MEMGVGVGRKGSGRKLIWKPSPQFYIGRQSGGKSGGTGPYAEQSGGPPGHSGELAELAFRIPVRWVHRNGPVGRRAVRRQVRFSPGRPPRHLKELEKLGKGHQADM
jgi:hypothetical protein